MVEQGKHFVLNLAPTGMVLDKKDCSHLPVTHEEVCSDVTHCSEIGLTTVHLHARHDDGAPTSDPDVYARLIDRIRNTHPELVVCVSCSGRNQPSFESRARVLDLDGDLKPDMASLTTSSLNFSRSASVNAPDTVRRLAERMRENGIKPEIEIFDLGMVNYVHYLIRKDVLEAPFYFNIILGNIASAQADPIHVGAILRELPKDSLWSLGGIGRAQLSANAMALCLGGGVRVGLEDNIWFDEARTTMASNRSLTARTVEIGRLLGRTPMPPAVFRSMLGLAPLR